MTETLEPKESPHREWDRRGLCEMKMNRSRFINMIGSILENLNKKGGTYGKIQTDERRFQHHQERCWILVCSAIGFDRIFQSNFEYNCMKATPGQYSGSFVLSNWNRYTPKEKAELFGSASVFDGDEWNWTIALLPNDRRSPILSYIPLILNLFYRIIIIGGIFKMVINTPHNVLWGLDYPLPWFHNKRWFFPRWCLLLVLRSIRDRGNILTFGSDLIYQCNRWKMGDFRIWGSKLVIYPPFLLIGIDGFPLVLPSVVPFAINVYA